MTISGNYSDDGNSCIALAESLVECKGLDGPHAAMSYAKAWQTVPTRGYPPSAKVYLLICRSTFVFPCFFFSQSLVYA